MKTQYVQFIKTINLLYCILTENEETQIPLNLEQFLDNIVIDDNNYFLILDNLILILFYIKKNTDKFEKIFSKEGHISSHIPRIESKSLFPSQIIKCTNDEYLLVISCKKKIFKWVKEGFSKKVKKALILQINGKQTKWVLGVDSVSDNYTDIMSLINDVQLTNTVNSIYIHQVIEGADYIGKNGIHKKSLISKFAEGGSLDQLIKKNNLNFVNIFIICYGSVVALQVLHQIGITHNDLNEGNIFLVSDEKIKTLLLPKIADLGNAKKHAKILSNSFNLAAAADLRKLAFGLFNLLKSGDEVKDDIQQLRMQRLSEMMKRVYFGLINYKVEEFVQQLDRFLKEMIAEAVPQTSILEPLVTAYYPEKKASNCIKGAKISHFDLSIRQDQIHD